MQSDFEPFGSLVDDSFVQYKRCVKSINEIKGYSVMTWKVLLLVGTCFTPIKHDAIYKIKVEFDYVRLIGVDNWLLDQMTITETFKCDINDEND